MPHQKDLQTKTGKMVKPSAWVSALDQTRVRQLLVISCAGAILATMAFMITSIILTGTYFQSPMFIVDGLTMAGLSLAILLAVLKRAPRLQTVLICLSIPANLVAEIVVGGAGAWPAVLLLGLSPFMWGLFTPVWTTVVYTIGLVVFFNFYLITGSSTAIFFGGSDQTLFTALALNVISTASAIAAVLPRKITGAAYSSLNRVAQKESVLKQRYAHYAKLASDWHLEIDETGIVTDFFGSGDATGRNWRTILFDWEQQADIFHEALRTKSAYEKIRATLCIGELSRRVECSGQPIFHDDGSFAGYRVVAHDITEKAEAEEKLRELAMCDRLTGVRNRHAFNISIDARQSQPPHKPTAVVCIDLDNFKLLNDRQGHVSGDAALRELGLRFKEFEEALPGLEIFRLGGDEFCALLETKWDPGRLRWLADQFAEAVSRPVEVDDRLIDLSASIGIACTGTDALLSHALERADAAVYEAKSLGGGRAIICEGDVENRLDRRLAIRRDISSAIACGEIEMHYQPIFDVQTGRLDGVEALARWTHRDYGNISPDEFITIAEGSRSIIALGQYTLRLACTEALQWMERTGETLRLNVNVSPVEIMSSGFVESLEHILDKTQFPANLLELEITERGMLEDIELSRMRLNTIRKSGVAISLDDFGTGHSSLSRLESLPVDRIKVDRSFFAQAGESRRAQQLLALMSGISNIMGVDVVAEGIETEDQLRLVRLAGFSKVQGYLLGRPGRLRDLEVSGGQRGLAAAQLLQWTA